MFVCEATCATAVEALRLKGRTKRRQSLVTLILPMKLLFEVIVEPVNSQHVLVIPTTTDVCVCGQSTIRWSEYRTLCVSPSVQELYVLIGHNWICLRLTTFIQVKEGRGGGGREVKRWRKLDTLLLYV